MYTFPLAAAAALYALASLAIAAPIQYSSSRITSMASSASSASSNTSSSASQFSKSIHRYKFTTLNDNADPTFNQLLGINNNRVIAGYFGIGSAAHPNKGYTLSPPYTQASYTNENFPNSTQTQVTAINNKAETAGFWVDANGNSFGFILAGGIFTSVRNPNTGAGTVNQLLGINDNGVAVGFYTDANNVSHGYTFYPRDSTFKAVAPQGGVSVTATGINDAGDVCGFFTTSSGTTKSFLMESGGRVTEFFFPGSSNTQALGVNNARKVAGVYTDNAGMMHGFLVKNLDADTKFQSIDDPNGVGTTTVNGLNENDDLVGFYVDSAGNTDGMLAIRQ